MSQFFKFLFASCLGVILASFAIVGIAILILAGIASSSSKPEKIKPNSVLELTFDQPIPELTNNLERDPFQLEEEDVLGLSDIVASIRKAKDDKNIKGILIKAEMESPGGIATSAVIRDAIQDFKTSGKFVIAYSNYYSKGSYYLASTADKIYLHPMGLVDFRGFAVVIPFFKEMLDKIGISFHAFYAGDFKSATEPYRRTNMSKENRTQLREFINEIYGLYLGEIAKSRNTEVVKLDSISDKLLLKNAASAQSLGFVDALGYRDEVIKDLKDRLGIEEKDKISTVSIAEYFSAIKKDSDLSIKDKIAVVYAEGTILDGKGEMGQIGDQDYVKMIEKLRKDEKIKAIVLRVNSPGGSGLASENIWRELQLAKEAGKKIVVSMGDYAASGGYYISCAADSIFAESETLTGSIGVFNLFPDVTKLMNDKLGIRFDTVKTGEFSAGFNPAIPLTEQEGAYIQSFVDEMYERFLSRVADARKMTRDEVHAIAQGRIWSGNKGVELGLVDKIGGLDDAVKTASRLAGVEKYRIITYPKPKGQLQQIMEQFTNKKGDLAVRIASKELGEISGFLNYYQEIKQSQGIQFRMPFLVGIQ